MHIYQKHILDLLRKSDTLRYSQLQPDGVESSHFKYHLNQLINAGSVKQVKRGVYTLTTKGKSSVDRMSRGKTNPDITPKIITYTLLKDNNNYYLQRKDREPYFGLINMVGGKVHLGESTQNAAKREVFEKTKQRIDKVTLNGIAEIRISHENTLLSHVIAYVYSADVGNTFKDSPQLTRFNIDSLSSRSDLAPDLLLLINEINSSKQLFSASLDLGLKT